MFPGIRTLSIALIALTAATFASTLAPAAPRAVREKAASPKSPGVSTETRGIARDVIKQLADQYDREIELTQRRLAIADKLRKSPFVQSNGSFHQGSHRDYQTADAEYYETLEALRILQKKAADLRAALASDTPESVLGQVPERSAGELRTEGCDLETCLGLLGQLGTLTQSVSGTTATLAAQELLKSPDAASSSDWQLARAAVRLREARFGCERKVAEASFRAEADPAALGSCLAAKVRETGIAPKRGGGPGQIRIYNDDSIPSPEVSIDKHSTGKEKALAKEILQHRDSSVAPWDVFEIAYRLNNGDMYAALRTAFNGLRIHRHDLTLQRKLLDITGQRNQGADNSGAWYHFFGTMLAYEVFGWKVRVLAAGYNTWDWLRKRDNNDHVSDSLGINTAGELYARLGDSPSTADERATDVCRMDVVFKRK